MQRARLLAPTLPAPATAARHEVYVEDAAQEAALALHRLVRILLCHVVSDLFSRLAFPDAIERRKIFRISLECGRSAPT